MQLFLLTLSMLPRVLQIGLLLTPLLTATVALAAPATAPAPAWIGLPPTDGEAARAVAMRLHRALLDRDLVARGAIPDDPFREPAPGARANLRKQVAEGERLFFEIELGMASDVLSEVWRAVRERPALLDAEPSDRKAIEHGLLMLVRALLQQGRDADAGEVAAWLARTMPELRPGLHEYPEELVALTERARDELARTAGTIHWEAIAAEPPCTLWLDGVPRGEQSAIRVPAGSWLARVRCSGGSRGGTVDGWWWPIVVPSGGTVTLRSAPALEAKLEHSAEGTRRPAAWTPESLAERLAPLARALGRPIASPVVEQRDGRTMVLVRVYDGEPRILAEAPLPADAAAADVVPLTVGGVETWGMNPLDHVGAGPYRTWIWVTLGTGIVLTAAGGGLHIAREVQVNGGGAASANAIDGAYSLQVSSIVLYSAGGAALASSLVLYLLGEPQQTQGSVDVSASPSGLSVLGRF